MTGNSIESPYAGGKMRASWGASVARAVNAHEAELQSLRQPGKWQSLRAGDESPLTPFAVRLHKTEDDPDGQWEIYLPPGCCNVGGTCDPINPKANATSGHEDDGGNWYRFDFDQGMDYATTDGEDTQTNRYIVRAHAKTSAKLYGVDGIDAPARKLLWIGVVDQNRANGSDYPDSVRYKDTPGDTWSCVVAEILATKEAEQDQTEENGDESAEEVKWNAVQIRTTPVDVALPAGTGVSDFDLVWDIAVTNGGLETKKLLCVRQTAAAAGITITGDTMTDVLDASDVYARIDTTNTQNGYGIVEVLKDPHGTTTSTPYVVWLPLYGLKHNTVVADHRPQSLTNIELFHA